jgi:hypothetical protein
MLASLATFAVAATLIVLLPGPDTLVVVWNLLRGGRRMGVRAVMGILTGLTIWVVTAALGLSAVLRASHDAYLGLRIAGAVYLIALGVRSLRSRGEIEVSRKRLLGTGYTSGLLTDLLNQGRRLFRYLSSRLCAARLFGGMDVAALGGDIRRSHRHLLLHPGTGLGAGHAVDGDHPYTAPNGPVHSGRADRLRPPPGHRAIASDTIRAGQLRPTPGAWPARHPTDGRALRVGWSRT